MGDYKITVAKIVSVLESNDTKFLVKKKYMDTMMALMTWIVSGINLGLFFSWSFNLQCGSQFQTMFWDDTQLSSS